MTPRDLAVRDIKNDLNKQHKAFLTFHSELNPVMRRLVLSQIREQINITHPFNMPVRHRKELIARCFFCNGKAKLENYSKYYEK